MIELRTGTRVWIWSARSCVSVVALSDIASHDSSGTTLDIQGCEFALLPCAKLLKDAKWIVGELHYVRQQILHRLGQDHHWRRELSKHMIPGRLAIRSTAV